MTSKQRNVFGMHLALCFAITAVAIIGYCIPCKVVADGGPLPYQGFGSLLLYYMFHTWLGAVWVSQAAVATWLSFNHSWKAVGP